MSTRYLGLEPIELARVLEAGTDHTGSPVTPFVDAEGDWPLRCCLTDSHPGERLAVIGFSNFPWTSPYRATGPVVVHHEPCAGPDGSYPAQFDARDQIVRAYGTDDGRRHTLVYDLNALVPAGSGLSARIEQVLDDPRVEFVQSYNVRAGCYSFTARRDGRPELDGPDGGRRTTG